MRTHESDARIAIQPETDVEQSLVSELFTRLNNLGENGGPHPEKVGSRLVFYTLDLAEYEDLDHGLWAEAECAVNSHGRLDPDPGSRALVVVHSPDALEGDAEGADQDDVDEALEEVAEEFGEDEEGQDEEDGEDEFDLDELMLRIEDLVNQDDPDYGELQGAAMDLAMFNIDVKANQSTADLVADLGGVLDDYRGDDETVVVEG